jgi:aconitate hydratase
VELVKGPNIASLPELEPLPDRLEIPIILKVGDDISTDEILRAGTEVLPYRSNIPKIAEFTYDIVDATYPARAAEERDAGRRRARHHRGTNYGQGSSREHAAIAPRFLGLRVVIAKEYARIHWQNLANFGVLALEFVDPADWDRLEQGDMLVLDGLHALVDTGEQITIEVVERGSEPRSGKDPVVARHRLSDRQRAYVRAGGVTNWMRDRV